MPNDKTVLESNSKSNDDYQKVGFIEAFKISKWGLSLFFKNHPWATTVYIISLTLSRIQDIVYTLIFARALDELMRVIQEPNAIIQHMYPYLAVLLAYSIFETLLSFVSGYAGTIIRMKSDIFLKKEMYYKLKYLGIQTLEQPDVSNKIFRANSYLYNIFRYVDDSVELFTSIVKLAVALALVLSFMPIFVVMIMVVSIPYLLIDKGMRRKIYKPRFENTEENRRMSNAVYNLHQPQSLQEITITGSFNYIDRMYTKFMDWLIGTHLKMSQKSRVWSNLLGFTRDLTIFYGYLMIFGKFLSKSLSIGNVAFWMRSLNMLETTITNTITIFNNILESAVQIKDVYSLFMMKPSYVDGKKIIQELKSGPSIEFSNVNFSYPNAQKLVIKNLSLKIKAGEKVAIVGQNGAGKTTLVKLLCKFYPTTSGSITVDGEDIKEINSESLYRNLGTLFQDFNYYSSLSVKDNIIIGRPEIEPDEVKIRVAAQTADALGFIEEYPKKFNQILSESYKGGIRPSTGQWQKIALARFFYRNAPLVIFDEPTAAIDPDSEYNIFTKIYEFFEDKTVIIISHRFSTVRNADRIIVLDDGQIVEQGTHEELLKLNGKYANSFRLQAEGYKE